MRIRWTRHAECDLAAVEDNAADGLPATVILRILDVVERLADHPHLGRPGRIPDTRELIISGTPYIVPYRVRGNVLEVLRVLHGAMRWPERL